MEEGPSLPAARRVGAAAGTPVGTIASIATAAVFAGPGKRA